MFKNILILILFVLLFWLSQEHITGLITHWFNPAEITTVLERKKSLDLPLKPSSQKESHTSLSTDLLGGYLKSHLFDKALSFYLHTPTQKNHQRIVEALQTFSQENPPLAMVTIEKFLEHSPSRILRATLSTLYANQGHWLQAISEIKRVQENVETEAEEDALVSRLHQLSKSYIRMLQKDQKHARIRSFLENMMTAEDDNAFYRYQLALHYDQEDKLDEVKELLEGLSEDEEYGVASQKYLDKLTEKEKKYDYAIPLTRYGDHFIITLSLDGVDFRLMLDTGATYIFLDENKATMFEVLRDDVLLQTAGGDIQAKLCTVSLLEVGRLKLSNIQVTVSAFTQEGIDGLLGMNFFKQFTFFVDQERNILYLKEK